MLRLESESGWWLITHPDHARLAGEFAAHWGNETFLLPEPRTIVVSGIAVHDDGWAARDQNPVITRKGKPSAFSHELVGGYSAFEEIDLRDYLAVRERAVQKVESENAYAALLVTMHTYNLLTQHADRSTISVQQIPLLDEFLEHQRARLDRLRGEIRQDPEIPAHTTTDQAIHDNFHLLQATDNLSLLSCVAYMQPSSLLHAMRRRDGSAVPVRVQPLAERSFVLSPYPFNKPSLSFHIPARHVEGKRFSSSQELASKYHAAVPEMLEIAISANA